MMGRQVGGSSKAVHLVRLGVTRTPPPASPLAAPPSRDLSLRILIILRVTSRQVKVKTSWIGSSSSPTLCLRLYP
ncbi:hypothetical protein E2C01_061362 [Portunus trituberculatus]|uniref:Uncharacterized protein n=1 Tax=Portunus trituberculatus TaxID=210409 RepID=A0A5B7HC81_PORTR|nr:hypothetical protein [Portunus trituberculatus]